MKRPCFLRGTAIILFILSGCNSMFYVPVGETVYRIDPLKVDYSDHSVPTTGNHTLHARYFPSISQPSRGLILHFHGNSENLTAHFFAFHWLVREGWDYLIFDYSGYGRSGGSPGREQLRDDGVSVLQFAWDSIPSARQRLIVAGQSLGGAVAPVSLAAWSLRDTVDLLILDATFPNYRTAVKSILDESWAWWLKPLVPIGITETEAPEQVYDRLSHIPVLVTHCEDDSLIKPELGREVFQGLRSVKTLWLAPECGHIGFFSDWMPAHRKVLAEFLRHSSYEEALQGPFTDFHRSLERLFTPPTPVP